MSLTESALIDALKTVVDPNTGRDLVSTKQVRQLKIEGGDISFEVELGYPAKSQVPALRKALIAAARTLPGVENVSIQIGWKITAHAVQRGVQLLPRVKNIVAVASGKGG
ncbi:MAG: iron-sulfur cluster assembly protein, partial [Rubrivivax sp.]